ncbi:hypothetical protein, partial [Methyloprofundus sedimenti]|uniref:hypothetical protein n=1 Tax=Methyloprofundus sedimenti TaxID=1420851 RepID=UPI001E52D2E1
MIAHSRTSKKHLKPTLTEPEDPSSTLVKEPTIITFFLFRQAFIFSFPVRPKSLQPRLRKSKNNRPENNQHPLNQTRLTLNSVEQPAIYIHFPYRQHF